MAWTDRPMQPLLAASALALPLLFALCGEPKPPADWTWLDIAGEGGTALMSGLWAALILGSRPAGRVTTLLAGGLAAVMLGAWADCLDEIFVVPAALHWIESVLTPLGMLALTWGLHGWRDEQSVLNAHLFKRERLFREHRAFDRLTQLADAAYLQRQIALERTRRPLAPCALVLLELQRFHLIDREHGPGEGDRVLQAVAHQLLLNLRNDALLCRYARERFVVLLPETPLPQARREAAHLRAMVEAMSFHARASGARVLLGAEVVCTLADADAEATLQAFGRHEGLADTATQAA